MKSIGRRTMPVLSWRRSRAAEGGGPSGGGAVSRKTPEKGANIPLSVPGTRSGMEQGPFRKAGRNRFLSPFKELFRSKYNKFFKIVYTFL